MKNTTILILLTLLLSLGSVPSFSQEKQQISFKDGTTAYFFSDDGNFFGVESINGEIIVPNLYEDITRYGNIFYCTKKKNAEGKTCEVYHKDGTIKIKESDNFKLLLFYYVNRKWTGFGSLRGEDGIWRKYVIDDNGDYTYIYREYKDSKGFKYLINEISDTIVVEPGKYTYISISHGFINVKYGTKEGVLNLDGSVIIPPTKYSKVMVDGFTYINGFIASESTNENGLVGYYDTKGVCIIPPSLYTSVDPQNGGSFKVTKDGKVWIIDSLCNVILKTKYSSIWMEKDGYYTTYKGNGKGKMALDGTIIHEPEPTHVEKRLRGKDGFEYIEVMDTSGFKGIKSIAGKVIIPNKYKSIDYYIEENNGLKKSGFLVKDYFDFVGYYDVDGKMIIPCRYHKIEILRRYLDYFKVELSGRCGLCDKKGKEIIKPFYDDIKIRDNQIYAQLGIMTGVLNFKGRVIVPFEYTEIDYDEKTGDYEVNLFGRKGICSSTGKLIIPPKYTWIFPHETGGLKYYSVEDGEMRGLYTRDGKMLFPATLFENVYLSETGSLAKSRGISDRWYIRAYNGKGPELYYDLHGNLVHDSRNDDNLFDKYCDIAYTEFNKKNFSSAIKYYMKALDLKHDQMIYYNVGVAYYNQGKYEESIKFFSKAKSLKGSLEIRNKSEDLITQAKYNLQVKIQRKERAATVLLGVLGSALSVGNVILQTNTALNNYNNHVPSIDHSLDYLLDPNYAIYQTQQKFYQEYLQETNGGQTMSYDEYMNLRSQAFMESKRSNMNQYDMSEDQDNVYNGNLSPDQYKQQYARYENVVKSFFNNLSTSGSYTTTSGNKKGVTDSNMQTAPYAQNKMGLRETQNQMRRIRLEAENAGVHIPESKWETATAGF